MSTIRQVQIQNRLVEEVSDMIRRDLRDPRLEFVTVTGADISRDLKYAKVYLSTFGKTEDLPGCVRSMQKAAGFIRGEFARRAGIRIAPEIIFEADQAIVQGARIHELLSKLEREHPISPDAPVTPIVPETEDR